MNITRRLGSKAHCLTAIALFALIALNMMPSFSQRALAAGGGTVYVNLYGCPSQKGAGTTNHDVLLADCGDPTVYASMKLITEGNEFSGQATEDNSKFTFSDVPAHIFTLRGNVDPYYSQPVVYCQNSSQNGAQYQQMVVSDTNEGSTVHPTMDAGGYVTCDWFATNYGVGAAVGSVQINGFVCPAGVDPAAELNALVAACKQSPDSVDYTVESLNNYKDTKTVKGSSNAYWQTLNPDFLQITASLPAGLGNPRVFCQSNMNGVASVEFPDNGATFAYNLRATEVFTCRWFMSPLAGAIITINNHLCPSGPDLESADLNTLAQSCGQKMNGVPFTLKSSSENRSDATGLNQDSVVTFQNVIAGKLSIIEGGSYGSAAPRVFCSLTSAGDSNPSKTQEQQVNNASFDSILNPGDELDCDWFNINDGGVGQVGSMIINSVSCPDGFDAASSDYNTTIATCTSPLNGIPFQLVTQASQYLQSSGSFEQGKTFFYGVPVNEGLTLVGNPLDGYAYSAVYCGQALKGDGTPLGFDRMDLYSGNAIYPSAVAGGQEICLWVATTANGANQNNQPAPPATPADTNAPDNGNASADNGNGSGQADNGSQTANGGVSITNRVCPSGFDVSNADYNALDNNCNDNGNGYDFYLVTSDGPIQQTSGSVQDQAVVWSGLNAQSVAIQETISGNLTGPIVFCDGSQVDASSDGVVLADVPADGTVNCVWFTTQN